ncbi:MAG: DUF3995 domain-containing protein [Alphaproteobacteria bacterium]|nr:DUF3995 domain-containing protein [Alphaproteobacteria bacterium]
MITSIFLACVLFAVSAIHLIWAAGYAWPCADRQTLLRTVVGNPNLKAFPSAGLTFAAALAIAAAGLFALLAGGSISLAQPRWLLISGLAVLAAVFLARGVSSYTIMRIWSRPDEPFATLDRRYYAPLCLIIGTGFGWLLWQSLG